jgi:hypothetical protein
MQVYVQLQALAALLHAKIDGVPKRKMVCVYVFSTIQLPSSTVFSFRIIEVQSLVLSLETRYHS